MFAGVVKVPDVEVADLGAFGSGNADDGAGGCGPGAAGADRDGELLNEDAGSLLDGRVKVLVHGERRTSRGEIGRDRFRDGFPCCKAGGAILFRGGHVACVTSDVYLWTNKHMYFSDG